MCLPEQSQRSALAKSLEISLNESEVADAITLAEATLARYATRYGYYRNTLNSHLLGRLGEVAVDNWLKAFSNCEALYRDSMDDARCDLLANGKRLEVKTWNPKYWHAWGRCVAVRQFPAIQAKADLIIWCTAAPRTEPPATVTVHGWNYVNDISNINPTWTGPTGREVHNFQVPLDSIRQISDLELQLKADYIPPSTTGG